MEDVIAFAATAHSGQTYDGQTYLQGHLEKVFAEMEQLIARESIGEPAAGWLLAACYLHDTIEDCGVTREELDQRFGPEVAWLVWAVTDEKTPGDNRKLRKSRTYVKIRDYGELAVALKLADRIANVRAAVASNPGFLKMYRKEQPGFESALRAPGRFDATWELLNGMLYPGGPVERST
jgi:(p)ppGpp synthase/HD superfamily hydrolase